jgi:hypothetical protein
MQHDLPFEQQFVLVAAVFSPQQAFVSLQNFWIAAQQSRFSSQHFETFSQQASFREQQSFAVLSTAPTPASTNPRDRTEAAMNLVNIVFSSLESNET